MHVLNCVLIRNVIKIWALLSIIALLYPLCCLTFDFSFATLVFTQGIHLISAISVLAWLSIKSIPYSEVEKGFISIFILQTIIQIVVYLTPSLGNAILEYNHYDPDSVVGIGSGVRGKALSAATTYHLTMAYGIAFILYLKNYFNKCVNFSIITMGLLLFIGIFFAGRTGFVGCGIGIIGWLFDKSVSRKITLKNISKLFLYTIFIIGVLFIVLSSFFPEVLDSINKQILPYAFEFLYSLDNNGQLETASTNRLKEMWSTNITFFDLIVGTGHYTNSDGSFYMHVDPGILRHMLFMGVIGYLILVIYQYVLFPIFQFPQKRIRYYAILIFTFLILMEFKCINLGVNKFAFSITLLLSYSYLYLNSSTISSKYLKQ
ncbi:MAG: hypothetical protein HDS72_07235 [Bacteroidales bacterium]|nr:hypothetical protein [Bacteroidales bacterium]